MNSNPRKIALALATAGALVAGLTGCTSGTASKPSTRSTAPAYPDCDLGDLRENDKDCKDPRALSDAVRKYGRAKVEAALAEGRQKLTPKVTVPKAVQSSKPGIPGLRKSSASGNKVAPKAATSKSGALGARKPAGRTRK